MTLRYPRVAASVTAITAPVSGSDTQKTQRQLAMSIIQAANSGPTSRPKPCAKPHTPTAKLRWAIGKELTTIDNVAGAEIPIPMPWMARPLIISGPPAAIADISRPTPKMQKPITIILTSPTRSPIRPPATNAAPNARL